MLTYTPISREEASLRSILGVTWASLFGDPRLPLSCITPILVEHICKYVEKMCTGSSFLENFHVWNISFRFRIWCVLCLIIRFQRRNHVSSIFSSHFSEPSVVGEKTKAILYPNLSYAAHPLTLFASSETSGWCDLYLFISPTLLDTWRTLSMGKLAFLHLRNARK